MFLAFKGFLEPNPPPTKKLLFRLCVCIFASIYQLIEKDQHI